MWTGLLFTVTIIVISYFSGLYFGTVYQKAVYNESKVKAERNSKTALQKTNTKRQEIAGVAKRG